MVTDLPASAEARMQAATVGSTPRMPGPVADVELGPPEVADDGGGQGPHAHLHGDHVGLGDAPALELVVDLPHDRGVAVDDPAGDVLVAGPRGVGDDQAASRSPPRPSGPTASS